MRGAEMRGFQWIELLSMCATAGLFACAAQAQTPDDAAAQASPATPPAHEKEGETALQDIVVTANRFVSSVQRTPAAISAVSGDQLSESGVTTVADLLKVAAAIQFTPIRDKAIPFIRGVGQGISAGNADPAVAINLNDTYLPAEMSNLGFFDIDRVEVLYGPQGTLYGRNAVGGAVNIITRRPGKEFSGDVETEVGNYANKLVTGGVDLPISSGLGLRIAGRGNWHSGYFSNGENDADEWALRATAAFEPTNDTSVLLIGSYSRQRGIGSNSQNLPPATRDPWYLDYDPKSVPLFNRADAGTVSLQIEQSLGELRFTSISGYARILQDTNFVAYLNTPGNVRYVKYDLGTRNLTQEFRLTGGPEQLKWIAGVYGYDTRNGEVSAVSAQVLPSLEFVTGPWQQHAQGAAAFGQATYALLPTLRLTVGGRFSYDRRLLSGVNENYFNAGTAPPPPTIIYRGERSDNRPDFKGTIEWDIAPSSLLYTNFQSGYNNGGFSTAQAQTGSPAAAPFASMTVQSVAAGSKNRFIDNRLQFNAELFHNRYRNYQVSARSLSTGQATVYNAARAETYGAQLDARAQITSQDELNVALALLHAEFLKLIIPGGATASATDLSGLQMPLAAGTTVNAGLTHHFPLPASATLDLQGNYRHVSGQWGVYNHLAGTYIKPYDMGDLLLTYSAANWSAGLFVRNLSDVFTPGFTLGGATPGPAVGIPLPPRTYGARVSVTF